MSLRAYHGLTHCVSLSPLSSSLLFYLFCLEFWRDYSTLVLWFSGYFNEPNDTFWSLTHTLTNYWIKKSKTAKLNILKKYRIAVAEGWVLIIAIGRDKFSVPLCQMGLFLNSTNPPVQTQPYGLPVVHDQLCHNVSGVVAMYCKGTYGDFPKSFAKRPKLTLRNNTTLSAFTKVKIVHAGSLNCWNVLNFL